MLQSGHKLNRDATLLALRVWADYHMPDPSRQSMNSKKYSNTNRTERQYRAPGIGVVRSGVQFKIAVEKATGRNFLGDMRKESDKYHELQLALKACDFKWK